MIRHRTPVLCVTHRMDDGAIPAGRLAEQAAVIARGKRAEFAIDERNELARQVVRIAADRRRVHVLVAAERREAVGERDDHGPDPAFRDEPRDAFGDVLVERTPVEMREPRTREAHEVEQHWIPSSASARRTFVVTRRQPYRKSAHVRIAESIPGEDFRVVLEHDDAAGRA